jgi:hypothetical protein
MTEAKPGLLDYMGRLYGLMSSEGVNEETARQLLEAEEREQEIETNVIRLSDYRKIH